MPGSRRSAVLRWNDSIFFGKKVHSAMWDMLFAFALMGTQSLQSSTALNTRGLWRPPSASEPVSRAAIFVRWQRQVHCGPVTAQLAVALHDMFLQSIRGWKEGAGTYGPSCNLHMISCAALAVTLPTQIHGCKAVVIIKATQESFLRPA